MPPGCSICTSKIIMNTEELQFNIIFTPHTAAYLSPFIYSLLRWTDCRYRIVNNGCDEKDQKLLKNLCDSNERLEYLTVSEDTMVEHGVALNWLQKNTSSPWFCFMDSDILATAPYLNDIAEHMTSCDVFSSGHPLWHSPDDITLPESFRRLHGIHFGTSDGKCLGGTYFAVYNNAVLTEAIKRTGIDFRIYQRDSVPEHHRATLQKIGLDKLEYDTGMLLMSLMYANDTRFYVEDLQAVRHLGGFSSRAGDEPAYFYRGLADRLATKLFGGVFAAPLLYLADCWYAFRRPSPGVTPEQSRTLPFAERRLLEGRIRKRRNTARYFKALMQSISVNGPRPQVPKLGYAAAERRIAEVAENVAQIYREHPPGNRLQDPHTL
jgi:hypothetical protein